MQESINSSSRCDLYKNIHSLLDPERYLFVDMSPHLRRYVARFRCSSHKLNIELGRHINVDRGNRVCTYCLCNEQICIIEDEYHVFFECKQFYAERQTLLFSWYHDGKNLESFYTLLKSENITVIKKNSNFYSRNYEI